MSNESMHHREPKSEIDDTGNFLRAGGFLYHIYLLHGATQPRR
jgi:hypothetical protein